MNVETLSGNAVCIQNEIAWFRQNSRQLQGQLFFHCATHDEAITMRAMRLP